MHKYNELSIGYESSFDELVGEEEKVVNVEKEELNKECEEENNVKVNVLDCEKRITELTSEDIWGLEFASDAEVISFYSTYARLHGFVMRRDDMGRDLK